MVDPSVVKSKSDFLQFVARLRKQMTDDPTNVENPTLDGFLEALCAWAKDTKLEQSNEWALAADLLKAAARSVGARLHRTKKQ